MPSPDEVVLQQRNRLIDDVKEMFREQWQYRELLAQLTARDLILRYKQTIMGVGWAVFMPVLNTIIFTVIFTRVAPLDTGVPYPLFAFCGLWAWNFFATAVRFSLVSLTSNVSLVTKVYFPKEILPFSTVAVAFVDFLVGGVLMAALMWFYDVGVTAAVLALPVVMLVQIVFTAAIALIVAVANLFFRDVKYLFEVVITVWMFATSVIYPLGQIGGGLGLVLGLNPMTPIVDAYRRILLYGTPPEVWPFVYVSSLSIGLLLIGWIAFHRLEDEFAERI